LNSKDFFDQFYQKTNKQTYSKSLYTFFEEIVRPRLSESDLKILELGSGDYSLFEDIIDLKAEVTAIDFSSYAIERAPKSKIYYREMNLLDQLFFKDSKFDLVFDSHCLNCITSEEERNIAYKYIFSSLKVNGYFAAELMIQPNLDHVSMPFKMIKSALDLEEEIISHGFKILYFTISRDSGFTSLVDGKEIKCDLLKLIAQK
jgi:hypothetical protein